uniref:phosphoethanolamine N-methyltransferase n=1 Tax=Pyrodinium bahamense TaxID=73915 RepID=A0A7S0FFV0_9DINO|mmetsp:Transcript_27261/g.74991  ORF Transcript_27261/g.74991 Transcript_27261/m.74991 type:complete len:522 (+) Transcript_27261:57-1622(+)
MAHHQDLSTAAKCETSEAMQKFLSSSQYDFTEILKYERCFGKGFMSAGGYDTTKEFIDLLRLPKATEGSPIKVLDVGCGVGGSAFYFAAVYGASVIGLDLSTTSLSLAQARLKEESKAIQDLCTFVLGDACELDYEPATFDVVYSRDALLHVSYEKKLPLFQKFRKWLKPGGQLLISDYGCGEGELSEEMKVYMAKRQYALLSPTGYGKLVEDAGFGHVDCQDRSWQYCKLSRSEIDRIKSGKAAEAFDAEYGSEARLTLIKVFSDKVDMCLRGDRTFVLVHAITLPSYYEYRRQVLDVCKRIYAEHLCWGTDGNVSIRIPGTDPPLMAIKGSGIPYEDLTASDIVLTTLDGKALAGEKKPSSEVNLHVGLYAARPDANGIVHTHSLNASAVACCRLDVPCYHYSVGEICPNTEVIKCAKYHCYGTPALAAAVVEAVGTSFGCLMANHGQVCCGESLADAMYYALRMENICEMYLKALQAVPFILTKADMDECRQRDKTYGQSAEGDGTGHGLGGRSSCCA